MSVLDKHIDQIKQLCKEHQVKSLFAFGSVLTDKFNMSSDVDFIVDIDSPDPVDYTDQFFALKSELQNILINQVTY